MCSPLEFSWISCARGTPRSYAAAELVGATFGVMVKQYLGLPERGSTWVERQSGKVGAATPG